MEQVVGAAVGSLIGFIAIIAGALYNAKLNRDRDQALREEERKALCGALLGDLCGTVVALGDRWMFIFHLQERLEEEGFREYPLAERLAIAPSMIMDASHDKMHLLPVKLAREVTYAYRSIELARNLISVLVAEFRAGKLSAKDLSTKVYFIQQTCSTINHAAEELAKEAGQEEFWAEMVADPFFTMNSGKHYPAEAERDD